MKVALSIILCIVAGFLHVTTGQVIRSTTNEIDLNLTQDNHNGSLPMIAWKDPVRENVTSEKNFIRVEADINSGTNLKTVTLRVLNAADKETMAELEFPEASNKKTFALIRDRINLPDGESIVEVEAVDMDGGKVFSTRKVIVGMDDLKDVFSIDRRDHAILFATDIYENWNDLNNPVFDATTISKELEERYGFDVELVKNPSLDQINIKLREYAERDYKPQDQLFVFFAGHGVYDETFGEGYIVARNSLRNDKGKTSYMSHSNLRTYLNNIPCDHIFLTLDVCFGGTFDPLTTKRSLYEETDDLEFIVRKLTVKSRKYLTSGGKEYVPDGTPGSHSPFAKKLLEALLSNGGKDQILTLNELTGYMERLQVTPMFGNFGDDETAKGSDFLFISR